MMTTTWGYELRTTLREGFWPVDALMFAAREEWAETGEVLLIDRKGC